MQVCMMRACACCLSMNSWLPASLRLWAADRQSLYIMLLLAAACEMLNLLKFCEAAC